MTRIVTTTYRYRRPPRKKRPIALEMPVIVAPRKRVRLPEQREAEPDDDPEATARVKAFFARMIRRPSS